MAARYTVRTDAIPSHLRIRQFVAWVNDAKHPDDPINGAVISWHMDLEDAYRVCAALNADDPIPVRGVRAAVGRAA